MTDIRRERSVPPISTDPAVPAAGAWAGARQQPASAWSGRLQWAGAILVAAWVVWLALSLAQKPLPRAVPIQHDYYRDRRTYIPEEPLLGMDFHHNYSAARTWLEGGSPYVALRGDPANAVYVYPPLCLAVFAWTDVFPPHHRMPKSDWAGSPKQYFTSEPAILLWLAAIVAITVFATWKSWRARAHMQLEHLPLLFMAGAVLASYPLLFELERGNCDVLPLGAIILLTASLSWERRHAADIVQGFCVACAVGIKPYAIVLFPGLFTLRRVRATLYAIGWLAVEVLVFWPQFNRWWAIATRKDKTEWNSYMDWSHTIIGLWHRIWIDLKLPAVAILPSHTTVIVALAACGAAVGWKVLHRAVTPALAWPYLLWLTAIGTMLTPITYDYNLLFVPLAALSVWSARDSWRVQACIALLVPWCLPFFIGLTNLPLLLLKTSSVLLLGVVILRRIDEAPRCPPPWMAGPTNAGAT